MNTHFNISLDTQAILLLCGALGRPTGDFSPLTLGQYNVLALALNKIRKRPADLLNITDSNDSILADLCAIPNENHRVKAATPEQILGLLRRGVSLSTALNKWASYDVHVISRADKLYPQRLRDHLKAKAPPLLYYIGDESLLSGGGMAFVGARDITNDAAEALKKIVRECTNIGMNVVSGGAKGADQISMQESLSCGGKVIGVLPSGLLKASLDATYRDAISKGQTLLISAFDPGLSPYNYGQVAMERNKYIYGMADACFVAQSGIGKKSGTWSGAEEELKNEKANPVFVYMGTPPSEGCVALTKKGAIAWDNHKTVTENIKDASSKRKPVEYVCDNLFEFSVAEKSQTTIEDYAPPSLEDKKELLTPYGAFLSYLKDLLQKPHKETDVRKKLVQKLDLLPSQLKHWLTRAEQEMIYIRKEYQQGKKKCVMLEDHDARKLN